MSDGATPWQREGLSFQDLEAPFSREGDMVRPLSLASVRERQHGLGTLGDGSISSWRYVGPDGRGRHRVSPPDDPANVVVLPGPPGSFAPGSYVMVGKDRNGAAVLGVPPDGLVGASGFVIDSPPAGQVEDYRVTSVESDPLTAGTTNQPVTLRGYGLNGRETFQAVVYNEDTLTWDPDPHVTLHDPTNVSDTETTIQADLGPGVPPTYPIRVLYRRS